MAKRQNPNDLSLFDLPVDDAPPPVVMPSAAGGGDGSRASRGGNGMSGDGSMVALHEAAQARYLNYALSVITARALPDVRDGRQRVVQVPGLRGFVQGDHRTVA